MLQVFSEAKQIICKIFSISSVGEVSDWSALWANRSKYNDRDTLAWLHEISREDDTVDNDVSADPEGSPFTVYHKAGIKTEDIKPYMKVEDGQSFIKVEQDQLKVANLDKALMTDPTIRQPLGFLSAQLPGFVPVLTAPDNGFSPALTAPDNAPSDHYGISSPPFALGLNGGHSPFTTTVSSFPSAPPLNAPLPTDSSAMSTYFSAIPSVIPAAITPTAVRCLPPSADEDMLSSPEIVEALHQIMAGFSTPSDGLADEIMAGLPIPPGRTAYDMMATPTGETAYGITPSYSPPPGEMANRITPGYSPPPGEMAYGIMPGYSTYAGGMANWIMPGYSPHAGGIADEIMTGFLQPPHGAMW